jgi:hypothetical protein
VLVYKGTGKRLTNKEVEKLKNSENPAPKRGYGKIVDRHPRNLKES